MKTLPLRAQRALTLPELMIVVVIVGIIVLLAAPSMSDMIGMQRLRGINDQLVTDIQYMRSEATSRSQFIGMAVRNQPGEAVSCYVIFSNPSDAMNMMAVQRSGCDCSKPVGTVCDNPQKELRTVQVPRDLSVQFLVRAGQPDTLRLSPITGGAEYPADTFVNVKPEFCIEVRRTPRGRLRTGISPAGRPSVCSPDNSVIGVPACKAYDAALNNCQDPA
jgi:prepilin-type N-terminal cleavage/methylation domain-containing protein